MYKSQMLLQRIACFVMIFACALVFIYSLGLTTDLYGNNFAYYAEDLDYVIVEGSEIYYEIQGFNRDLTTAGLVLILLSVGLLVLKNHTRRKYYLANYLAVGANAIASIIVAAWALPTVDFYKNKFLAVDFETLEFMSNILKHEWTDSTFWFDAAYGVFAILMIAVALLIVATIFKVVVMRSEKRVLRASARKLAKRA